MKKIIPFGWLPAHWGTAGKTREIMKAEYELQGYELDLQLLRINRGDKTNNEHEKDIAKAALKHGKISQMEYRRELARLADDPLLKELGLLEIDYELGDIKQIEYDKKKATLLNEPWVIVLNVDVNKKTSLEGSFELDWNKPFVEKLKAEGYVGVNDEIIVNQWFMELCRNVALEEFDGLGDFTPDSEANLDTVKRWSQETLPKGRKAY